MAWLDLFKRGETADEALLAVATEQGWAPAPSSGISMLPPSHAAAGMHSLADRRPPACAGRAFAMLLGLPAPGSKSAAAALSTPAATISHLEITVSDEQNEVYNMVTWRRPAVSLPRFEAELGAAAWNHHRLVDRFQPAGSSTRKFSSGAVLRLARDADPSLQPACRSDAAWAELMALANEPALGGCVAEAVGDQIAVFTWSHLARKGRPRWLALVSVAECLDAWVLAKGGT